MCSWLFRANMIMRGKATTENIRACNSSRFTRKLGCMWRFCEDCEKCLTNASYSATCRERAVFGRNSCCGAYTPNFYRTGILPREVRIPISRNLNYTLYIHRNEFVCIYKKKIPELPPSGIRERKYTVSICGYCRTHERNMMLRFFELFIYAS